MGSFEDFMIDKAVKDSAETDKLRDERNKFRSALQFVKELSGECLENGDVRVGTGAEVAMRHIWRKADETLG
jgi:hypothetical protein